MWSSGVRAFEEGTEQVQGLEAREFLAFGGLSIKVWCLYTLAYAIYSEEGIPNFHSMLINS